MNDDILRLYLEGMDELLNEAYQLEEEFKRRIVKLETLFLQENAHRARHQSRYYHSFGNLKMWVEANEDIANADLWQKELNAKRRRLDEIEKLMAKTFDIKGWKR
jgi:hypothetical protein